MKNWEPFVSLPAFAMDNMNGWRCLSLKFSIQSVSEAHQLRSVTREPTICELLAIYGLSSSAIPFGEVTPLNHEVFNHAVEGRVLVSKTFLARAQCPKVLDRLGDSLAIESEFDSAKELVSMTDVEEDLIRDERADVSED